MNYPPGFNEQKLQNTEIDLHEKAGLICIGIDEDGALEWLGSKEEWEKYYQLLNTK